MKIKNIFAVTLISTAALLSCEKPKVTSLSNESDSLSYAIGLSMGGSLTSDTTIEKLINYSTLYQGITEVKDTTSQLMNTAEAQEFIQAFFQRQQEKQMQAQFGDKIEEEKKFLAENKTKEGIKETASGLQYQILTEGDGEMPTAQSQVTVHYTGTLLDGTVFDSSVQRGEPATFPVGGVIAGWTEALQLMKKGAKWKLFIPSELGYGTRGAGQSIPPYSTLIFEVELLEIQ